MVARAVIAAITAGATAAIGVLLVIGIEQLAHPIDYYGAGPPTVDVTLMFVVIGIVPAMLAGGAFGLVALTPYAYARQRFTLGLGTDVLALLAAVLIWSMIQEAAGPLEPPLVNFALILAGSAVGLLPLRRITAAGERAEDVALLSRKPSR